LQRQGVSIRWEVTPNPSIERTATAGCAIRCGPLMSNVRPQNTQMTSFPPELQRYRFMVVGSSLLLAGAGLAALVLAFSPGSENRSLIPFVAFAIVAFAVSGFGLFFAPRWYRRAADVVSGIPPVSGMATFTVEEDSDSTSLYAAVSAGDLSAPSRVRVALLFPRWDVRPLCGAPQSVRLHIDPFNSRLMAVTTTRGTLWCMPTGHVLRHHSAVKKRGQPDSLRSPVNPEARQACGGEQGPGG